MKLFLFAVGPRERASSRLRIWDHVAWLRNQGYEVRSDSLTAPGWAGGKASLAARIVLRYPRWVFNFLWCDSAIVQETLLLWPSLLLKNFGKRRRLIFDFSDPVDRIGAGLSRRLRQKAFGFVVRRADAVIVENKAYLELLKEYGAKCYHFYGPVDVGRYYAGRKSIAALTPRQGLRIGWSGSPGTYQFIAPLMPIIDELARDRDIEVMLIGVKSVDHIFRYAKLTLVEWEEDAEFHIVPTFDLGLFRLDESDDALWRGAGKLFIYMAAGVPFVASARGIARALMKEAEVGFAVEQENDWAQSLRAALEGDEVRQIMAKKSLAFAADHLSYELYRCLLPIHVGAGEG